jgi:diguanylate cyclase (GGDEF)-like protein/PAS domain S-box-containing protein
LLGTDWFGTQVVVEDRDQVRRLIDGTMPLSQLPTEIEYSIGPAGASRLFRWHLTLIRDFDGRPVSLTMMGSDITEWRRSGDSLRLTARVFDTSNEAMLITDQDNKILSVNASFTRLTGYTADEARGQDPKILSSGRHDRDFYREMWKELKGKGFWRGDVWDRRKDGTLYPKYLAISTICDEDGRITHYSAIFHDVSERKALEAELDHLAHFDELTDLPNRALLQDRLEQAVAAAERRGQRFALLFVDLDGFKPVNDNYGHDVGDEILKLVAQRLRHAVRGMDTAARLGGDEFVIVLNDIRDVSTAGQVAEKIAQGLSAPYKIGDITIGLSASIGISVFPLDEVGAQDLLRAADEAMYIAKRDGKNRVHFYNGNT